MSSIKKNIKNINIATYNDYSNASRVLRLLTHSNHYCHLGHSKKDLLRYAIQEYELSDSLKSEMLAQLKEVVNLLGKNYLNEQLKLSYEEYIILKNLKIQETDRYQNFNKLERGVNYNLYTLINILNDVIKNMYVVIDEKFIFKIITLIFKDDKVSKNWITSKSFKLFLYALAQRSSDIDTFFMEYEKLYKKYPYIELWKIKNEILETFEEYED